MRRYILLVSFALAFDAHATKIIGNGGYVQACREGSATTYELYDFWFNTKFRDMKVVDPGGHTYQEKCYNVLSRLALRFLHLTKLLTREFEDFVRYNKVSSTSRSGSASGERQTHGEAIRPNSRPITDSQYHLTLEENCEPVQAVWRLPKVVTDDPMYLTKEPIWEALGPLGQCGMAIHESFYSLGSRYGLTHPIGVHFLTGAVFSDSLDKISDLRWIESMRLAMIPFYELSGIKIPLFNGEVTECTVPPGGVTCVLEKPLTHAHFEFTKQNLQAVSYSVPHSIHMDGIHGLTIRLRTQEILFDRSRPQLEFTSKGKMMLISENPDHGLIWNSFLNFEGKFIPALQIFEGKLSNQGWERRDYWDLRFLNGSDPAARPLSEEP